MPIGNRIRKQRELLGISQTELAERVKISKQTLYKYEKDIITNIPSDNIEKISKILNVSESYLMGWEDEESKKSKNNPFQRVENKELSREEVKMLEMYRQLPEASQEFIYDSIMAAYEKESKRKGKTKSFA